MNISWNEYEAFLLFVEQTDIQLFSDICEDYGVDADTFFELSIELDCDLSIDDVYGKVIKQFIFNSDIELFAELCEDHEVDIDDFISKLV